MLEDGTFFNQGNWTDTCHQEDGIGGCQRHGEYFTHWDWLNYQHPMAYFSWNTCPSYNRGFCQTDKTWKLAKKAISYYGYCIRIYWLLIYLEEDVYKSEFCSLVHGYLKEMGERGCKTFFFLLYSFICKEKALPHMSLVSGVCGISGDLAAFKPECFANSDGAQSV